MFMTLRGPYAERPRCQPVMNIAGRTAQAAETFTERDRPEVFVDVAAVVA